MSDTKTENAATQYHDDVAAHALFELVANRMSRIPAMRAALTGAAKPMPPEQLADKTLDTAIGTETLPKQIREQIAIAVSAANESEYCLLNHVKLAQQAGVSSGDLIAARSGKASDPKTQTILELALEINQAFNGGTMSLREAAWKTDLTQKEIMATMVLVATNVLTNCLNSRKFSRAVLSL